MDDLVTVTFAPSGVVARVSVGSTVLEAAQTGGVAIPSTCGGRATCGSCGVRVLEGELSEPDELETAALRRAPQGVRLACRAQVVRPVTVRPLMASATSGSSAAAAGRADASSRPAEPQRVVAAVDLGTTTVAAVLAEADGGRRLGEAVVANTQQSWGSDVLSRVSAALDGAAPELRDAARTSVGAALRDAAGGRSRTLERVVVAGNTVMASLIAGADVASLAAHPFGVPAYSRRLPLSVIGEGFGEADAVLLPAIAGFVGGDVLAGLLHVGMLHADGLSLLVDLGTNAEIVLAENGRLWVASAAAGSAFEGVGMECGVTAGPGAVTSVTAQSGGTFALTTIDDAPAVGLSGAGVVSAIAALLEAGTIAPDGLMSASEGGASVVVGDDGVRRVWLDEAHRIAVTQRDVRTFQLAKAAVRTGIESVLAAAGTNAADVAQVHVAGAFGGALKAEDLVATGVLPASMLRRVHYAGNASLAGALCVALEPELLEDASRRAETARHVELALDPAFSTRLMAALELAPFGE